MKINSNRVSYALLITLWIFFITNIGLLNMMTTIATTSVLFYIYYVNSLRPTFIVKLFKQEKLVILIYSLIAILIVQFYVREMFTSDDYDNLYVMSKSMAGLLLMILTVYYSKRTNAYNFLFTCVALTSLILFVSIIIQLFFPDIWGTLLDVGLRINDDSGQSGRAFGLMQNTLDMVFILGVLYVTVAYLDSIDQQLKFSFLVKVMILIMLLLTFSRSAIMMLVVIMVFSRPRALIYQLSIVFIVAVFLISGDFIYGDGMKRALSFYESGSEFFSGHSTDNRLDIINYVVDKSNEISFFGTGFGSRNLIIPSYWRSHNLFIETFVISGYFGLIVLVLIIMLIIILVIKLNTCKRNKAKLLIIPFISLMTIGHIFFTFTFYFYLTILMIFYTKRTIKKNQINGLH